ncbi:hypothetical protein HME9302_01451 [Alteripontixanthobacter maritimus]|uniref:Uncharacterized protein n=1 Tax=Alteripontixanthobacter maritimus TaxID=2161824 RepID=A0A369Q775_9SPHN|nr:hypothetical protein [Alteripontixanthobacter maritimus]RDC60250.1 hypothetical protein HME9302_01451 [Alteripontixanthobacter maritimus]
MRAVVKTGASREAFHNTGAWTSDGNGTFIHRDLPITVAFPKDDDGVSRTCVVEAVLESRGTQSALKNSLKKSLGKPLKQQTSMIWMVQIDNGVRGLQFFTDEKSEKPKVRLIATAF